MSLASAQNIKKYIKRILRWLLTFCVALVHQPFPEVFTLMHKWARICKRSRIPVIDSRKKIPINSSTEKLKVGIVIFLVHFAASAY
jgi:hypothetical protein